MFMVSGESARATQVVDAKDTRLGLNKLCNFGMSKDTNSGIIGKIFLGNIKSIMIQQ